MTLHAAYYMLLQRWRESVANGTSEQTRALDTAIDVLEAEFPELATKVMIESFQSPAPQPTDLKIS